MGQDTDGFLQFFGAWGPVVLAGFLVLVVLGALVSGRLSAARTSFFKTLFFGGTACFLAALGAQALTGQGRDPVTVTVVGAGDTAPVLSYAGAPVEAGKPIEMSSAGDLSVDVTELVATQTAARARAEEAEAEAASLAATLDERDALLERQREAFGEIAERTKALAEELASLRLEIEPDPEAASEEPETLDAVPGLAEEEEELQQAPAPTVSAVPSRPTAPRSTATERLDRAERKLREIQNFGTGVFR